VDDEITSTVWGLTGDQHKPVSLALSIATDWTNLLQQLEIIRLYLHLSLMTQHH